ncbi:MAG: type II secretion system GspH family protein, partial [Acetatifactor sp.]|nr:type II secretion system GspH family protein [Acetatifactor sp.]
MSGKNKIGNKGFTLVEIMLSIAILALISVPLMKYFSDSLRYAAQTAEKQKATMIAQETIEYIRSQKKIVLDHDVTTTPAPVVTAEPDPDAEVDPDASPTPEPTPVTPVTRKTYYLAPELTYLFGGYDGAPTPDVAIPEEFANTGATLDATGALESMVYRYIDKRSGKYLVEVSMNCTTPAYEVDSP